MIKIKLKIPIIKIRIKFNPFINLLIPIVILAIPCSNLAQETEKSRYEADCSIPKKFRKSAPPPEGIPTELRMGVFFLDIRDINDVKQTFTVDGILNVSWNDPRLSEKSLGRSLEDCKIKLSEIWHPDLISPNRVKLGEIKGAIVDIDKNGNVRYIQHYEGEFHSDFELKNFPFDTQVLHISVTSYVQDEEEIAFFINNESMGIREELSTDWDVDLEEPVLTSEYIASQDRYLSRIDFRLSVKRDRNYYLWNVILPLVFIVIMAWSVFWIDPSQLGAQIGLSTATVFTLIAYKFSLGFLLPRVSYFTRMDKLVIFSTLLVFLALGEAVTTGKIAFGGKKDLALKIDKWARVIYLIFFAIIIVFSLWL